MSDISILIEILFSKVMLTLLEMSSTPTEKEITNLCSAIAPAFIQTPEDSGSKLRANPRFSAFVSLNFIFVSSYPIQCILINCQMIQCEIPSTMLWKERAKTTNPVLRAALTCADVFWCSFSKSSTSLNISFIFTLHLCDCHHSFPQQFHSSLASLFLQHFGVGEENDAELPQGQKWRRIHKSLSPQQGEEICHM